MEIHILIFKKNLNNQHIFVLIGFFIIIIPSDVVIYFNFFIFLMLGDYALFSLFMFIYTLSLFLGIQIWNSLNIDDYSYFSNFLR